MAAAVSVQRADIGSSEAPDLRRLRVRAKLRRHAIAYCFLLPNLVAFAVFFAWPIVALVRQSLERGGVLGPATFVGLSNWKAAAHDPTFLHSLVVTGKYCLMVVPPVIVLGFGVALIFSRSRGGGGSIARVVILLPVLAPIVAAAFIWQFVVQPQFGLASVTGRLVGFGSLDPLGSYSLALPAVAALDIWRSFGFWSLVLLAALLDVPRDLYNAARLDGASALRRFWHVTLPGTRSTTLIVVVLSIVFTMQAFDSVFILTGGGPSNTSETAVLYMYQSMFVNANPGYGAALGLILVIVIILLTGAVVALFRRGGRRAFGIAP